MSKFVFDLVQQLCVLHVLMNLYLPSTTQIKNKPFLLRSRPSVSQPWSMTSHILSYSSSATPSGSESFINSTTSALHQGWHCHTAPPHCSFCSFCDTSHCPQHSTFPEIYPEQAPPSSNPILLLHFLLGAAHNLTHPPNLCWGLLL